MRAKEFISEDRQRLDEALPIIALIAAAGFGYQAYETYADIQEYNKGKIDKTELAKRIGTDAAFMIAGGAAGKYIQKGVQGTKATFDAIRKSMAEKAAIKAAEKAAAKAAEKAATSAARPPNTNLPSVKTGTTPGKSVKTPPATVGGAATGKATQQAVQKATKTKPTTSSATKGRLAGQGFNKALNKKMGPRLKGAGIAAGINQVTSAGDAIADKLKDLMNKPSTKAGDTGDGVVYFGKEKNPPIKKLKGVDDPLFKGQTAKNIEAEK